MQNAVDFIYDFSTVTSSKQSRLENPQKSPLSHAEDIIDLREFGSAPVEDFEVQLVAAVWKTLPISWLFVAYLSDSGGVLIPKSKSNRYIYIYMVIWQKKVARESLLRDTFDQRLGKKHLSTQQVKVYYILIY